ncbi:hypothetical protein ACVQ8M_05120 [Edwardsiella tarda]|uniref:hypothetical protein n=1 Tax=Edwardsiella tarda TaxID=636 RepID=UPI003F660294
MRPFQLTRSRRCGYCGSLSHCTQYCPKTSAGRTNIALRDLVQQQKGTEVKSNAAKNTEVVPSSRVWENNH